MTLKRKILRLIGILLIASITAFFIYVLLNHEEIRGKLDQEIQAYGTIGLIVAGFVIDVSGGPIGPEVAVASGLLAGLNIAHVVIMTFIGSTIGTFFNYGVGFFVFGYGTEQAFSHRKFERWRRIFLKHRRITMMLGALTPVPYEVVCILSGAFRVKLWEYMVFTVGARFLRISTAGYIVLLLENSF